MNFWRGYWGDARVVRIRRKLVKWAFFSLILGFLSVAAAILVDWLSGTPTAVADITFTGEPFLVSLAIVAGGLGELVFDRRNQGLATIAQGVATWTALVMTVVSAIAYGVVRAGQSAELSSANVGVATPRRFRCPYCRIATL
ncbi:hypothetical protein JIG36_35650 [Actinoplanes sp. LDG1-06]|uniref:Uncharacterized protein n=1 Tax=Paractinoplanes ovalisporus TaxID=2810368 RepID=A0ABS2ALV4_9ACTN|nr:hypothetical protein [Actinoplanes ovalisporus]MBM2620849.1 hypothetical protein [Actinoplanes ovalisporus]